MPGKKLYTADTLSRAPIAPPGEGSIVFQKELEYAMHTVVASLPANKHRLQEYRDAQAKDTICSQIMKYCRDGWPRRSQTVPDIHPYQQAQSKLTVAKELLLYSSRIVVPSSQLLYNQRH